MLTRCVHPHASGQQLSSRTENSTIERLRGKCQHQGRVFISMASSTRDSYLCEDVLKDLSSLLILSQLLIQSSGIGTMVAIKREKSDVFTTKLVTKILTSLVEIEQGRLRFPGWLSVDQHLVEQPKCILEFPDKIGGGHQQSLQFSHCFVSWIYRQYYHHRAAPVTTPFHQNQGIVPK